MLLTGISWLLFSSKLVGSILAVDSAGVGRQGAGCRCTISGRAISRERVELYTVDRHQFRCSRRQAGRSVP